MKVSTQLKLLNTKNYYRYLKENSIFIKDLNRGEFNFIVFDEFVKNKYTLKLSDKASKLFDDIDNIKNLLDMLK